MALDGMMNGGAAFDGRSPLYNDASIEANIADRGYWYERGYRQGYRRQFQRKRAARDREIENRRRPHDKGPGGGAGGLDLSASTYMECFLIT
jgi:hypothetical protein